MAYLSFAGAGKRVTVKLFVPPVFLLSLLWIRRQAGVWNGCSGEFPDFDCI